MHFRGVKIGKIIETSDDVMSHSYPFVKSKEPEVINVEEPKIEEIVTFVETKEPEVINVEEPEGIIENTSIDSSSDSSVVGSDLSTESADSSISEVSPDPLLISIPSNVGVKTPKSKKNKNPAQ